jgi:hypothetical protein
MKRSELKQLIKQIFVEEAYMDGEHGMSPEDLMNEWERLSNIDGEEEQEEAREIESELEFLGYEINEKGRWIKLSEEAYIEESEDTDLSAKLAELQEKKAEYEAKYKENQQKYRDERIIYNKKVKEFTDKAKADGVKLGSGYEREQKIQNAVPFTPGRYSQEASSYKRQLESIKTEIKDLKNEMRASKGKAVAKEPINAKDVKNIVEKLIDAGKWSDRLRAWTGIDKNGDISFGPQSSAQTNIKYDGYGPGGWPKPSDFWYKEYDMDRKTFVDGNKWFNETKKNIKKAIQFAGGKDADLDLILKNLEEGASIAVQNKNFNKDRIDSFKIIAGEKKAPGAWKPITESYDLKEEVYIPTEKHGELDKMTIEFAEKVLEKIFTGVDYDQDKVLDLADAIYNTIAETNL